MLPKIQNTRWQNEPKQKSIDWSSLLSRLPDRELIRQDQIRKSKETNRSKYEICCFLLSTYNESKEKKDFFFFFIRFESINICVYVWMNKVSFTLFSIGSMCVYQLFDIRIVISCSTLFTTNNIFRVIFDAMCRQTNHFIDTIQ